MEAEKVEDGGDGQPGGSVLVPVKVQVRGQLWAVLCSSDWHSSSWVYFSVDVQSCLARGSERLRCKVEACWQELSENSAGGSLPCCNVTFTAPLGSKGTAQGPTHLLQPFSWTVKLLGERVLESVTEPQSSS